MIAVPLARAFGGPRRLLAFSRLACATPIRSDALRTLSFSVALKEGRSCSRRVLSPNPATVKRAHPGMAAQDSAPALTRALPRKSRRAGTLIASYLDCDLGTRVLRIDSIAKDTCFLRRGAPPAMLDKTGDDMVPLCLNLRPPKEKEAAGIIIHRLLQIKDLRP